MSINWGAKKITTKGGNKKKGRQMEKELFINLINISGICCGFNFCQHNFYNFHVLKKNSPFSESMSGISTAA